MARLARVVAAGVPHHVTQRGNRRQQTFFTDDDYRLYRDLMAEWCGRSGVEIWAYCLMPNHVHLIATPETAEKLRGQTRLILEAWAAPNAASRPTIPLPMVDGGPPSPT